jgi:uncharacterized protein
MSAEIFLRFYEELNDYLPPEKKKRDFACGFEGAATVGRMLERLGVPVSEVELVLVNGLSADLQHSLSPGDRVSIYPVFESFDVKPLLRIRREPLRRLRFLVDPQLSRLAFYLRRLGFEAPVESRIDAAEGARQIVLTANPEISKSGLSRVYVVRERTPGQQLKGVLSRFHLSPCSCSSPFFRLLRVLR